MDDKKNWSFCKSQEKLLYYNERQVAIFSGFGCFAKQIFRVAWDKLVEVQRFLNNKNKSSKIVFSVTIEELQQEAVRIVGRELNDIELGAAIKGVGSGLSFDIETVFKTAIEEATI